MIPMSTELEIVPHEIRPGRKIQVEEFELNNYQLQKCLRILSRTCLACLEGQSNNSRAELVPRDIRSLRNQWIAFKVAYSQALKHNDGPSGAMEKNYKILLPHGKEIQKIRNSKMQMVVMEMTRLCEIIAECDSAGSNGNIGGQSKSDIDSAILTCEDEIDVWMGSGVDNSSTGQIMSVFKHLGDVLPSVDQDFAGVAEPSAGHPMTGRPNVPDSAVIGD